MSENIVYVGSKPLMTYITAVLTCLNRKPEQAILKARGRAISTAVNVAETTRHRFIANLTSTVIIGCEKMPRKRGGTNNVSTIEITLTKAPRPPNPGGVS